MKPIPSISGTLGRNKTGHWCITAPSGEEYLLSPSLSVRDEDNLSEVRAILHGPGGPVIAYFPAVPRGPVQTEDEPPAAPPVNPT